MGLSFPGVDANQLGEETHVFIPIQGDSVERKTGTLLKGEIHIRLHPAATPTLWGNPDRPEKFFELKGLLNNTPRQLCSNRSKGFLAKIISRNLNDSGVAF